MTRAAAQTRSPIRRSVRRVPGESLHEHLYERYLLEWAMRIAFAMALVSLAVIEWLWVLLGTRPLPYLYSIIAIGAAVWAWWGIRRSFEAAKAVRLGLEGERAVADTLPVVLYPGWFVEGEQGARAARVNGPWVLNDRAFLKWVAHEEDRRGVLPQADLRLIVDRLERWPVQAN